MENQDSSDKPARRIEVVWRRPSEIKTRFGNPRKPADKKNARELKESLQTFGDFDLMLIDENEDIIAGNQRLKQFIEIGDDEPKLCKQLFGYSKAEKKAINIKSNVHAGTWDLNMLADWTADIGINLGIKELEDPEQREIKEMELIHYEKYDYVIIACRSELDYNDLVRKLGIEGKKVKISKRKINARAIWYDEIEAEIVPKKRKNEKYL